MSGSESDAPNYTYQTVTLNSPEFEEYLKVNPEAYKLQKTSRRSDGFVTSAENPDQDLRTLLDSFNKYTTETAATKAADKAKYEDYVRLKKASPGRDATILVPDAPEGGTLLGTPKKSNLLGI